MKRLFFVILTVSIPLCFIKLVAAEESVILQTRQWHEVYSAVSGETKAEAPLRVSFADIDSVLKGQRPDFYIGRRVEVQGFLEKESDNSFRIHRDEFPPSGACESCVQKISWESPRVFVSSPIIDQLKPGLVRVRGKIKMTRLPSASAEPVLEIDADSIFATESA